MDPTFTSSPIYQIVFWAAYLLWMVPEFVGMFFQRSRASADSHDRGSFVLLLAALWVSVFFAFFFAFGARFAMIQWHPRAFFFLGVFLIVAGTIFRWYAIRVLGASFTRNIAVRADQEIVQTGPYRYIRHPAYTGTLVTVIGVGLALGNILSLLVVLVGWASGHLYRVSVEEKMLLAHFGRLYQEYMQRTRRFIPFLF
jgi:protein-S-isoprenylcysteine O-methyltransferase Ste14